VEGREPTVCLQSWQKMVTVRAYERLKQSPLGGVGGSFSPVGRYLGPVQGYHPQLHQPSLATQPQYLYK